MNSRKCCPEEKVIQRILYRAREAKDRRTRERISDLERRCEAAKKALLTCQKFFAGPVDGEEYPYMFQTSSEVDVALANFEE